MNAFETSLAMGDGSSVPGDNCNLLAGLQDELAGLKVSLAEQFQALADALRSLSSDARQIAGLSREAAALATAGRSSQALEMLQGILEDAERIHELGETSQEKLHTIPRHLAQSRVPLARLSKLPFFLSALATLSRIEGTRIRSGTADVKGLADDIEQLAQLIEKHIATIATEADKLSALAKHSVQQLDEAKSREHQQVKDLTRRGRSVIESFRKRADASTAAAGAIDERYAGIGTAIDRIVMSLQSEDMARQRIEHIQQALAQVSLSDGRPAEAAVLALQRAQLAGTRKLVSDSVDTIRTSLGSLTDHVEHLTADTTALAAQTDQDGKSFAVSMGEELGAVVSVIGQYAHSARALVATVEAVLPALTSMSSSASEIEDIQSSIQLIALNASIKTAHLGSQGAAMGVLASELQRITSHSEADSRVILQSLQAMDGALKAISGHDLTSSALMSSRGEDVSGEVQRLSQTVSQSQQQISLKLTSVRETGDAIRDKLATACETAARRPAVEDRFESLLVKLGSVLEKLGHAEGTMTDLTGKDVLLSDLYSMKEERELHEQLFGLPSADGGSKPEQVAEAAVNCSENLGDSIELF